MSVKKAALYAVAFVGLCMMFWGVYFFMKIIAEAK